MRVYVSELYHDVPFLTDSHRCCFYERLKPGSVSMDKATAYFQIDNLADMQSLLEMYQGHAVQGDKFNFRLVKI